VNPILAAGILLLLAPQARHGAGPTSPPPAGAVAPAPATAPTFEELWSAYVKADALGDAPAAVRALREIRRARMERNVLSLDTVGLGLVGRGVTKLDAEDREAAEEAFRTAVELAPGLPDGYAGLALALLKKGPLGVVPSIDAAVSGVSAFLPTGRGDRSARDLATVAALLAAFAVAWAIAVALVARRGGLLRHDVEEWLGPAQGRSASLGLLLLLLLLPVATFQGWGWLPLWWLAILFAYMDARERVLALLLVAAAVAVGPAVASLELRLRTARNPLFHAALAAVESEPDPAAIARLEEAARADPEDRDLAYLLGAGRRRAGRYEEAAELYRQLLAADPADAIARNNLANIEFVRGSYDAARARYRAGTATGAEPEVVATSYYNLSLAHLQKFEYQAYNEAKSNADRLAPGLVADYDRWKYDNRDYAVVDLGLNLEQVRDKFAGSESGVAVRNIAQGQRPPARPSALAGSLANRFVAFVGVFALAAFLVGRWRGPKAFALHCGRCGTAFCRNCHLGQVSGGLCSQCYHLFVVRDGVSGPARNRKMAEVQRAEGRRERVFRVLSVLSPGAGQVYGGWTLRGAALIAAWYGVLALIVARWVVPFTEVPRRVSPPWLAVAAGLVLLGLWLAANRFRPESGVELPTRPAGPRRARAAPAAG
jgi:tetratricopeptide (TPR) repeat protein